MVGKVEETRYQEKSRPRLRSCVRGELRPFHNTRQTECSCSNDQFFRLSAG